MRMWFAGLVMAVALGFVPLSGVHAQEARAPGIERGIADVISRQMQAFRADDMAGAFAFAAPNIRSMFGTAQNFGAMVQQGYPMVRRPGAVRFGELRQVEGALWQKVLVTDADGRTHALDYRMERLDGAWRISAVVKLPAPDVAA